MAVTIAPYFPCLDDRHRYSPDLCASCPRETCWTGQPVRRDPGQLPIPAKLPTAFLLPRQAGLGCASCANVGDVTPPGAGRAAARTPIVWCERWHWEAPITEHELAHGHIPIKAGALAPCPDCEPLPAELLRPAVQAERQAHRERARRGRELAKIRRQQPPRLEAAAA